MPQNQVFQDQFREEFISGYEKSKSVLSKTVTTEGIIKGGKVSFLVADSGGARAVTRGASGDIPTRIDNLNQYDAILEEWHDVPERNGMNIFKSQGDGRKIMQETSMAVINRKIDEDIHSALLQGSANWGGPAFATVQLISKAKTKLRNASVGSGEMYAAITPAFHGELMELQQFTSVDYVKDPAFDGLSKDKAFSWYGLNWIVDEGLPGVGTTEAKCFMYSKSSIGHAVDMKGIQSTVGYDEKNDKSWVRCSVLMGSKLLQNQGVIGMNHDDSRLS